MTASDTYTSGYWGGQNYLPWQAHQLEVVQMIWH